MSAELRGRLYDEINSIEHFDPHTHIDGRRPASETLADILGYHYYTELAHSAGMSRADIEHPELAPKEKVGRLVEKMEPIQNTIQYSWFVEMAREFFGFDDDRVTTDNWEALYDAAEERMAESDWAEKVLGKSKLKGVFLTNDFDDPLVGFDTSTYIPCLRTDDLVFHCAKRQVRERLESSTGMTATSAKSMRAAIGQLFRRFSAANARACAISLPPGFSPQPVLDSTADAAYAELADKNEQASHDAKQAAAHFCFWTLAEYCVEFKLPFDLMIGVNRGVYSEGVFQGQDLYDSRVSLIQYKLMLNSFPEVTFPISVLASVTNQELASYAWIFPNVVTHGHWWYSNTPTFIEHDAAARLEAVPQTKQIGYYSDMYKLEFALPKFNMYKRVLAKILAERFVIDRRWSEERAIALGKTVLRDNVERVFSI